MTSEEAIALAETKFYESLTDEEIFVFQMRVENLKLCMPFEVFHKAAETALDRPVWTHEFANPKALMAEYEGKSPKATFEDVLNKLPEHLKASVIVIKENEHE